jgi:surfactin synthase thioesterase subunit
MKTHLFCLPYAGASAAAVYGRWGRLLPPEVKLVPLELAGHGRRWAEPFHDTLEQAAADLLRTIAPVAWTAPYALYGHSMGAALTYELLRALAAAGLPPPQEVFLSGRRPPHHACPQRELHLLADPPFLAEIRKLGGTPSIFFDSDVLLAGFLPILRSDYRLIGRYEPPWPLHVTTAPLTVLCGDRDPLADERAMRGWQACAGGEFRVECFSGGHFFINDHASRICGLIGEHLLAGADLLA